MRLACVRVALAGLACLAPSLASAAPPALPEGDVEAAPTDDATPPPPPPASGDEALPPGEPPAAEPPADAGATGAAEGTVDAGAGIEAGAAEATDAETVAGIDKGADAAEVEDKAEAQRPARVRGRHEPVMNNNGGGIGLFYTALPDVGGKYSFRFRLYTSFFRKDNFMYSQNGGDRHARVQGGVVLGFTPFKFMELFFAVNNSANRNSRNQPGRQDAQAIFALGDLAFGTKFGHIFEKVGIGAGGQLGLGLLSGSKRLLTSNVNFWFDGLFSVDTRYLTKKQFPFRFTTNIGWILDNSLKVANYAAITDPVSREVTRFSLGGNHNRVRMHYAVDFPVRFGKEKQFGIDPILEWSWNVSTTKEPAFQRPNEIQAPLPRSSQWLTIGLRANPISGLMLSAAADVGLTSPSFEYGPRVPPWQVILGLGWYFDPRPVIKEVPVENEAPPPPAPAVVEGRIIGQVVDPQGNPVPDAKIQFPGVTSGAILTDQNGNFTSYRFPAGSVTVQVMVKDAMAKEQQVEIADGQDTNVTIQLDEAPAPATGMVNGAFTDESGAPVKVRVMVVGQGVNEPFDSTEGGLILLELYAGEYQATVSSPGFVDKQITFTVPEKGEIQLKESLQRDKPPETPLVRASGKNIRLRRSIRYKGNDLDPRSHAALDQLATFLNYHKEYAVVEIAVHTDDRGAAKKRSDERADAVRSYLLSKGVSPDRLVAKGYGASHPVAVNMTASGRAKNNRTLFTVQKKQ